METVREPEFNINDLDYDYFFQEILEVYNEADPQTKANLLNLLWSIRKDYIYEEKTKAKQKEMFEGMCKAMSAI